MKGSAAFNGGTFTVRGGGADIWNSADAFNFTYQPLNGDGEVIARVTAVPNTNAWAKAGVMIRGTLAPNSAYALMLVSAGKGATFQYRTAAGAAAAGTTATAAAAPYWVKVTRSGNTITGYRSPDGNTWTLTGSASLTMGASVYIGLAVSSHTTTQLCAATFDNVTVTGAAPPPPPPPATPAGPSPSDAASGVSTPVTLSWTASGATTYDINFGATNPPPQVAAGQAAASVHARDAGGQHDLFLADRRAQQRGLDDGTDLVVHDGSLAAASADTSESVGRRRHRHRRCEGIRFVQQRHVHRQRRRRGHLERGGRVPLRLRAPHRRRPADCARGNDSERRRLDKSRRDDSQHRQPELRVRADADILG